MEGSETVRTGSREGQTGATDRSGVVTGAASLFPVFLRLAGRICLVVGAGRIGEGKISGLLAGGATVRVVAPRATDTVVGWAREGRITLAQRPFEPGDLDGVFLAVVSTASRELNGRIFRLAERRNILCNVVDDPPHCHFYYPSVVKRGDLQIAISTNGQSPALAQRLRRELERQFGPVYARWVEHLGRTRRRLFRSPMDPPARRRLLYRMASQEAFERFARRAAEGGH